MINSVLCLASTRSASWALFKSLNHATCELECDECDCDVRLLPFKCKYKIEALYEDL